MLEEIIQHNTCRRRLVCKRITRSNVYFSSENCTKETNNCGSVLRLIKQYLKRLPFSTLALVGSTEHGICLVVSGVGGGGFNKDHRDKRKASSWDYPCLLLFAIMYSVLGHEKLLGMQRKL